MDNRRILQQVAIQEKADELHQLGITQFEKGNYKEALEYLKLSHELNPKSIPNTLYQSLCQWAIIRQANWNAGVEHVMNDPDIQNCVNNVVIDLENLVNNLRETFGVQ